MLVPHSYPYLTEKDKDAILKCLDMEYIGYDDNVAMSIKEKLKAYLRYEWIETTPSASLAFLLILKYLKIQQEDEVVLSAINCWSVYNTIKMESAKAVICDVRSNKDFRASYETIESCITSKTKAIVITHMYGILVEEKIIERLKKKYPHIFIIEDFATSPFSKKDFKLGAYSDFAIGSFGSTKPLTGGIGGVLCSHTKIVEPNYDSYEEDFLSFNVKLSRMNQVLLLSQLQSFREYQVLKRKLIDFYKKFVTIYTPDKNLDLFRVITFQKPTKLINYLSLLEIELDIRESVQPNLIQELDMKDKKNAYTFEKYYSIPLNIKAYDILNKKGEL